MEKTFHPFQHVSDTSFACREENRWYLNGESVKDGEELLILWPDGTTQQLVASVDLAGAAGGRDDEVVWYDCHLETSLHGYETKVPVSPQIKAHRLD